MNQFHVGPTGYYNSFEPTQQILEEISQLITQRVNVSFGRVMITSVEHSVISPIYKSKRDNYVPRLYMENPSELQERVINLTVNAIVSEIESHFYREQKHKSYTIWNTVLGTPNNRARLVGHDLLKIRQNPLKGSMGMRY